MIHVAVVAAVAVAAAGGGIVAFCYNFRRIQSLLRASKPLICTQTIKVEFSATIFLFLFFFPVVYVFMFFLLLCLTSWNIIQPNLLSSSSSSSSKNDGIKLKIVYSTRFFLLLFSHSYFAQFYELKCQKLEHVIFFMRLFLSFSFLRRAHFPVHFEISCTTWRYICSCDFKQYSKHSHNLINARNSICAKERSERKRSKQSVYFLLYCAVLYVFLFYFLFLLDGSFAGKK